MSLNRNLIIVAVLIITTVSFGKTIYVDDDAIGANDGSNWENAYFYLQDALADANDSDKPVEVRVAQGTYKPDMGGGIMPGDKEAAFQLISGVTITGGYAGIGTNDPNVRDIELYETILSGDLNCDDMEFEELIYDANRAENSYHVLIGSGTNMTAVIDGFIITSGQANGNELDNDPFDKDRLRYGGGMYNYEGNPTLTNCVFSGNMGELVGGMYNNMSNVTLTNCTFNNNWGWGAGGMENQNSNVILTNCRFSGNPMGGICNYESSIILTKCTFSWSNVINMPSSAIIMTNCIFTGNYNAINHLVGDDPNSILILTNCTISGNHGAISLSGNGTNSGQGPILNNCIIWNNTSIEIPENSIITYSNIQGGWEGEGNIDEDPLFANPGYWPDANDTNASHELNDPNAFWIDDDYHLKSIAGRWDPNSESWVFDEVTSPCIDAGDPLSPVMYEPHPRGCIINMGAHGGTEEASKSPFGCSYKANSD